MKTLRHMACKIALVALLTVLSLAAVIVSLKQKAKTVDVFANFDAELFSVISIDDNIIFFGKNDSLSKRSKLLFTNANEEEAPLSILHIGDSHVQADFFTGKTRMLLSQTLNDVNCSRGFTFPYQVVGSNNPDDYDVTWKGNWMRKKTDGNTATDFGLAGIAVSTTELESSLTLKLLQGAAFDMVKVYFDSDSSIIEPKVSANLTYQYIGDGFVVFKLIEPTDSVKIGINSNGLDSGMFTLYGFELVNSAAKFIYHAAGVNGASVRTFLNSRNFTAQLRQVNPNFVILSLGTNDAYDPNFNKTVFRANLKELVSGIKSALPEAIVVLTTPGDHLVGKTEANPFIAEANAQIISVANDMDCGVWDFNKVMGGDGSIEAWFELGLTAQDKLHLNRKGYAVKGALLYDALSKLAANESEKRNKTQ